MAEKDYSILIDVYSDESLVNIVDKNLVEQRWSDKEVAALASALEETRR